MLLYIERVQKRYLKLLYPSFPYGEALCKPNLDRLDYRRDWITQNTFKEFKDPKHPIHYVLPPVKVSHSQIILRPTYPYQLPLSKATRYSLWMTFCATLRFQEILVFRLIIFVFASLLLNK